MFIPHPERIPLLALPPGYCHADGLAEARPLQSDLELDKQEGAAKRHVPVVVSVCLPANTTCLCPPLCAILQSVSVSNSRNVHRAFAAL